MAVNMDAGMRERKIFSNLIVKSKSPRQPRAAGPNDSSFRQPEKSIMSCFVLFFCTGEKKMRNEKEKR